MIDLVTLMKLNKRCLFISPPGMGKTTRIHEAAEACGRELLTIAAGTRDRVDFSGVIVPNTDKGIAEELPFDLIYRLQNATVPTVLLVDDLGNGAMDVQASVKSQITKGGPLSNNPNVLVWAATNRPQDKTGVHALHESLRSEFHLAFAVATPGDTDKPDGAVLLRPWACGDGLCGNCEVCGWCEWAERAGMPEEVIAWHRSTRGRTLYQWKPNADPSIRMADYRSWKVVGELWNDGLRDLDYVAASVGKPVAAEFAAYARLRNELPTPEQVWVDPLGAIVPQDPAALYLITVILARNVEAKYAGSLVKYMDRLPRVFAALLGRDAFRRLKNDLSKTIEWRTWFKANQALFQNATLS